MKHVRKTENVEGFPILFGEKIVKEAWGKKEENWKKSRI